MPGTPYTRCTVTGTIGQVGSAYEIFSYGFAIGHDGDSLTDANINDLSELIKNRHTAAASQIDNRCFLRNIVWAHRDATGHQDQPTRTKAYTAMGGASSGQRPSQVALAVSLRGPAAVKPVRGRFYLPMPQHSLDVDTGLILQAQAQDTANAWRSLIDDVSTTVSGGFLAIDSKSGIVPVTEVRVGRVLDTIRSRRSAPTEAYVVGV